MSEILTVPVGLGDRSYDVLVGPGALDAALERLPAFFPRGRAILVADRTVAEQHLGPVSEKLGSIGLKTQPVIVEPGETAASAAAELDRFVVAGASRSETTGFDPRESPVMLIRDGAPHLEAGVTPAAGERALGLMAHKRGVTALAAGGGFVFSAGGDGALFAWDRRTMRLAATVVLHALRGVRT